MSLLKIAGDELPPSSLELGGGLIFHLQSQKNDIELNLYHISCFRNVFPFLALSKATFTDNSHIVLSSPYSKAFIFNRLCACVCVCVSFEMLTLCLHVCVRLFVSA